jgi:hypothetical protein
LLQGVEVGDTIRLGRVLAHKADGEFKVGQPYLDNVAVEAEILEEFRGPKVRQRGSAGLLAAVYGALWCVLLGLRLVWFEASGWWFRRALEGS